MKALQNQWKAMWNKRIAVNSEILTLWWYLFLENVLSAGFIDMLTFLAFFPLWTKKNFSCKPIPRPSGRIKILLECTMKFNATLEQFQIMVRSLQMDTVSMTPFLRDYIMPRQLILLIGYKKIYVSMRIIIFALRKYTDVKQI